MTRWIAVLTAVGLVPALVGGQTPQHGVLTAVTQRGYDPSGSQTNTHETILTQANVKAKGIRLIFQQQLEGDARGAESVPLVLPNVPIESGSTRDVVVVSAMNGLLWEFDGLNSDILLSKKVGGTSIKGSSAIDAYQINDWWNFLSSGVIDPDTRRWYGVSWSSPDTTAQNGKHTLYCVDLTNASVCGKTDLSTLSYAPPGSKTPIVFGAQMRKQRTSLTLWNQGGHKAVIGAAGSVLETAKGAAGWLFAVDTSTFKAVGLPLTTAGYGAGVWQAGSPVLQTSKGELLLVTGNGSFNGTTDLSESVVKALYSASPQGFTLAGHWTPYDDAGRVGQDPTKPQPSSMNANKLAGVSLPGEMRMPVNAHGMMPHAVNYSGFSDEDLGSAPPTLWEKYNEVVASGKDSVAYFVNLTAMGNTMPADLSNPAVNCAKLLHPPIWFGTYAASAPCPSNVTALDIFPNGKTAHQHSASVRMTSPVNGDEVFVGAENSPIKLWRVNKDGSYTYLAASTDIASPQASGGGMTGSWLSGSSNSGASGTGLLYAVFPYTDSNKQISAGHLAIYDADHFDGAAGSGTLRKIWDSADWSIPFAANKFGVPVVSGGRIYYASYDGRLLCFGLPN